jgi:hypothetical protein
MAAPDGSISAGEAAAKAESGEAVMSFADSGAPDPADAILAEVLGEGGEAPAAEGAAGEPAEGEAAPAEGEVTAEGEPTSAAAAPAAAETPEAAKLRRAWAKFHGERQETLELQQSAKRAIAEAEGFRTKASRFDALVARLNDDPAGALEELEAAGLKDLSNRVLQGFIDREKSPAEREVAKMRRELAERDARERQAAAERQATEWRQGVQRQVEAAGEKFDLVNSLGLHSQVIDVMTGYYERHSERDGAGNVTKPAILNWETAAQWVEDHHAQRLEASKRYGKRAPASQVTPPATATKDASSAKPQSAPAKRAPTLSAVPVAEAPPKGGELSSDPDVRFRQVMAEMGLA